MLLDDAVKGLHLLGILSPATIDRSDAVESFIIARRHSFVCTAIERKRLCALLLDELAVAHT